MAKNRLSIFSLLMVAGLAVAELPWDHQFLSNIDLSVVWDRDADEVSRDLRMVESPVTPNRIADVMINNFVWKMKSRGIGTVLRVSGKLEGSVPFDTDNGPSGISVILKNTLYRNLRSIRSSKRATINSPQHLMSGTFMFKDLEIRANYELSIPAVGQAPASRATGRVVGVGDTYFIDYTLMTDAKGLPVGIKTWRPRKGKFTYNGATGLDGNAYKDVFDSVLKDSTSSALDRLINKEFFNIAKQDIMGKIEMEP